MRQEFVTRWRAFLGFGVLTGILVTASGCNSDLSRSENSSPIVMPDTEEGKKALASADAFVKLRQEQEAKARAKAAKRKKAQPEIE